MRTFRNRTAVLGAAATAVLALALTACGGDGSGTKAAGPADGSASAKATVAAKDTSKDTAGDAAQDQGSTAGDGAKTGGGSTDAVTSSTGKSNGGAAKTGGSTAGDTSDSYAYKHPCKSGDLSVRVYAREGSATQHVIEVNNTGKNSCGLSYFPRVSLGAAKATDHSGDIIPLVPSGLGGAPAYPVKPKTAAIAVIDLNPGGGNGVTWVDELNVLADGDHMANAEQLNFPLGPDVKVGTPKLGLYERTVADAVASMKQANTKP
ncbi:DUF4232 domain-containing protein [Streptomyces sp. NBC_00523]|uniref:DUF4232 domain-containing protein n=1 Tax=Streptomyces sp. NBC_00523 TaxID=2975765 RepID=UPI002E800010|nr:DUF4232 domain-containing protein [Streptomyces sp. NBC_00523]WUD01354.1 DUF4232 domain-containing protein [Streptomyces sp. NBC_00523]